MSSLFSRLRFYLASVEAAVEHVKLGNMNNVVIGAANPQKLHVLRRMTSTDGMWQKLDPTDPDMPTIDALFQVSCSIENYERKNTLVGRNCGLSDKSKRLLGNII